MRITELPNTFTQNIDFASSIEIIRQLKLVDHQLFSGFSTFPSILDNKCLTQISKLGDCISDFMALPDSQRGQFFMSGCGTSGRLAFFCARSFNKVSKFNQIPEIFDYFIAGTDKAIVAPQEVAEDRGDIGILDLQKAIQAFSESKLHQIQSPNQFQHSILGITCGLSAPYVMGQVDYALHGDDMDGQISDKFLAKEKFHSLGLLGFNPAEFGRDIPCGSMFFPTKTCKDLSIEIEKLSILKNDKKVVMLNPIVGPEGITGSTRMKGGSGTKIIVDTAFAVGVLKNTSASKDWYFDSVSKTPLNKEFFQNPENETELTKRILFNGFFSTCESIYSQNHIEKIKILMENAANSLKTGGHVYYIGVDTSGMLGFVDASECPPTYGANFNEVRGFIAQGWNSLKNHDFLEMKENGDLFKIGIEDFNSQIFQNLNSNDFVCFLSFEEHFLEKEYESELDEIISEFKKLLELKKEENFKMSWVCVSSQKTDLMKTEEKSLIYDFKTTSPRQNFNLKQKIACLDDESLLFEFSIPYTSLIPNLLSFSEYALKLILNSITTGAHVLKGLTFGNRMINVRISNNKLYYRAVDIIAILANVSKEFAEECMIRSIFDDDEKEILEHKTVESRIRVAVNKNFGVPIAILLASKKFESVFSSREILAAKGNIRSCIGATLL